jgi:hypothetical protein
MMQFNSEPRIKPSDNIESFIPHHLKLISNWDGLERRSGKDRRHDYIEKRKINRVKLKPETFVTFSYPKYLRLICIGKKCIAMINDISVMGLSAHYLASDIFNYKNNLLAIETKDSTFSIDNIHFKVISDYTVIYLPGRKQIRRCGIKFENTSDSQIDLINQLIKLYSPPYISTS